MSNKNELEKLAHEFFMLGTAIQTISWCKQINNDDALTNKVLGTISSKVLEQWQKQLFPIFHDAIHCQENYSN